jgi:predicted kinase
MTAKLIVLRGPSGSGKSTIAKALFKRATRKTCLIEQDYYRFIFRPRDGGSKANSATIHKMIKENVLIALRDGYDVILEGIFATQSYVDDLYEIFGQHPIENYLFYFDISLEETIRRHGTRPSRNTSTYTEGDLRTFYPGVYTSIHKSEKAIPESSSAGETLAYITETCGL